MTTFSQMVDDLTQEVMRPDMLASVATYLNQVIRELHADPTSGNSVMYESNLHEVRPEVNVENPSAFFWQPDTYATFQQIQSARYDEVYDSDGRQAWPRRVKPGIVLNTLEHYYYQSGKFFCFFGHGGIGSHISIAYYRFPRHLAYYTAGNRPCDMDEAGLNFYGQFRNTVEDQEQAELLCTNWLLMRWRTIVEEGVRAKIYKRLADDSRARLSYSLYMQQRTQLITSEGIHAPAPF